VRNLDQGRHKKNEISKRATSSRHGLHVRKGEGLEKDRGCRGWVGEGIGGRRSDNGLELLNRKRKRGVTTGGATWAEEGGTVPGEARGVVSK